MENMSSPSSESGRSLVVTITNEGENEDEDMLSMSVLLPEQREFIRGPRPPCHRQLGLPRPIKSYDVPAAIRARPRKPGSDEASTLRWDRCSTVDYREHMHEMLFYEEAMREVDKVLHSFLPFSNCLGPNLKFHVFFALTGEANWKVEETA